MADTTFSSGTVIDSAWLNDVNKNTYLTLSVPTTTSSAGTKGQVATDGTYFYVCIATNSWKRVALATW